MGYYTDDQITRDVQTRRKVRRRKPGGRRKGNIVPLRCGLCAAGATADKIARTESAGGSVALEQ